MEHEKFRITYYPRSKQKSIDSDEEDNIKDAITNAKSKYISADNGDFIEISHIFYSQGKGHVIFSTIKSIDVSFDQALRTAHINLLDQYQVKNKYSTTYEGSKGNNSKESNNSNKDNYLHNDNNEYSIEGIEKVCICIPRILNNSFGNNTDTLEEDSDFIAVNTVFPVLGNLPFLGNFESLGNVEQLDGIELHEIKPKSLVCKTIRDSGLSYAHGIVGAMSKDQIKKYCKSEEIIENKKVAKQHRNFANAVHTCVSKTKDLHSGERVKQYIECMHDTLSKNINIK